MDVSSASSWKNEQFPELKHEKTSRKHSKNMKRRFPLDFRTIFLIQARYRRIREGLHVICKKLISLLHSSAPSCPHASLLLDNFQAEKLISYRPHVAADLFMFTRSSDEWLSEWIIEIDFLIEY